jgi:tRNA pseudouridine38-40 synthase
VTRWKLTLEYDGTPFVGWQRQANGLSVQEVLEQAVKGFSGETATVEGAGRTDAGVHALGQVAHVDLAKETTADTVRLALNDHLKAWPVVVLSAAAVGEDFHARFSATRRDYLYRILNRPSAPTLDKGRVWWLPVPLDAAAMHAAAQRLVGHHDFSSFRAAECQAASPEKTLDRLDVSRRGEEIEVAAVARSFLHHQVRNMVGSLSLVGRGKCRAEDLSRALEARDRRAAGPTAPPQGLYLVEVRY